MSFLHLILYKAMEIPVETKIPFFGWGMDGWEYLTMMSYNSATGSNFILYSIILVSVFINFDFKTLYS